MKFCFRSIIVLLLFIFSTVSVHAQDYNLQRVEPLHWWTGMDNPELQVLMYGEDIGLLTPQIDSEDIKITRVQKVGNENYLFVYLYISEATQPGSFDIKLMQDGKQQLSYSYELKQREPGSENREGFNSSDVIYLITPDRFANGDPENDTVEGYEDGLNRSGDYGRHGGDIQGIIDHLDYIEEMGFTAIWINPVLENEMGRGSYHGYATTDYYKVDPRFGNNELYKKLSKEAGERGIKLIKDIITNHSGSNHWWMLDPPTRDWVHYADDQRRNSHRHTVIHDPYASEIDKQGLTDGWFVGSMPDLNQDNPLLADYIIYNSIWWIEYADLGGIRHDTHPYPGQKFMEEWTCRIMKEYPNFNIVGEEWMDSPLDIAKWQRGSDIPTDFGSCLPSLMDFPTQINLSEALSGEGSFIGLYENLSYDFIYPDPENLVVFTENHDMDRFYRQVNQDYNLFKMGLTYIMTTRGIPQFYYGTELLMSNEDPHSHGQIREDFPGGWASDETNGFTGEGVSDQKLEGQEFVRKLVNWRKNNPVIHEGKLMHYVPNDGLYVYFRYNEEKKVMVLLNKNEEVLRVDTNYYFEMLNGYSSGRDVITGKNYSLEDLSVPQRTALILELK